MVTLFIEQKHKKEVIIRLKLSLSMVNGKKKTI